MSHRILIVDDEPELVDVLDYLLRNEGYETMKVHTGREALACLEEQVPDLILLDVMLPDTDGFGLFCKINLKRKIPVLFLSARSDDSDVIQGLRIGGEDYVTKPFNHVELLLRIQKILLRHEDSKEIIEVGKLIINPVEKSVRLENQNPFLTPTEFNLLLTLARQINRVFSWEDLLKEVWGNTNRQGGKELVKVNIRRLRKKLEPDPLQPIYLVNVRGMGYKLRNPQSEFKPHCKA